MSDSKCGNDAKDGVTLTAGHCDNQDCICDPCECTSDNVCDCCKDE